MTNYNKKAEELADLIEANKNCEFTIDNDSWDMRPNREDRVEEEDDTIACSLSHNWMTEWYGHGSNYGAGISEALVILLNRRGFNISANAC